MLQSEQKLEKDPQAHCRELARRPPGFRGTTLSARALRESVAVREEEEFTSEANSRTGIQRQPGAIGGQGEETGANLGSNCFGPLTPTKDGTGVKSCLLLAQAAGGTPLIFVHKAAVLLGSRAAFTL